MQPAVTCLLCQRPGPDLLSPRLKAGSGTESKYPEKSIRLNAAENLIFEQLEREHGRRRGAGARTNPSDSI